MDDGFTDTCFLVSADIKRGNTIVARSTYFNKCTSLLCDPVLYQKYRNIPTENLRFENGPWLKPSLMAARKATLDVTRVGDGFDGSYGWTDICIKNCSETPAYPVTVDLSDGRRRFFSDDNFFMLKGGEQKVIRVTCREGETGEISVGFWNGEGALV
ncbi:MAG: hypothetical protein IJF33_04130 [Clostridia bacterium]|nr:hypothetical protein [Clostridia bacterium]